MAIREPECVTLKRRGAERIYRQLAGKSKVEQLAFWQERNQRMRARKEARRSKPDQIDTARPTHCDTAYIFDTFPIVRRHDQAAFGHYRTKAMILAYFNALAAGDTDTDVAV